ncbi:MAG: DUF504 domain-containing protein [Nitrososphaeraceae archaeon]
MGKKKGKLQEVISKAIYADNPDLYLIYYRDYDTIVTTTLSKFMILSQNLQIIPATRILKIIKKKKILYFNFNKNQHYSKLIQLN